MKTTIGGLYGQCELAERCGNPYFCQVWTVPYEDAPSHKMAPIFRSRTDEFELVKEAIEEAQDLPIWGIKVAAYTVETGNNGPIVEGHFKLSRNQNKVEWMEIEPYVQEAQVLHSQVNGTSYNNVSASGSKQAPQPSVQNFVSVNEQLIAMRGEMESELTEKINAAISRVEFENRIKELEKELGRVTAERDKQMELAQRFRTLGIQYKQAYNRLLEEQNSNKASLGSVLGNPDVIMQWVQVFVQALPLVQMFVGKKTDGQLQTPVFTAPQPSVPPQPPVPSFSGVPVQEEEYDEDEEDDDDDELSGFDDEFDIPDDNEEAADIQENITENKHEEVLD